jgi:hypothetical protein
VGSVKWYADPAYDGDGVDGKIMTIIAIVGLVVNVLCVTAATLTQRDAGAQCPDEWRGWVGSLAAVLMAGGHGHSHGGMSSGHGHSHGHEDHEEEGAEDEEASAPGNCATDHSVQGPALASGNGHVHHHHPSHGHSHAHAHGATTQQRRWWWPWRRSKGAARSRPQNINVRAGV